MVFSHTSGLLFKLLVLNVSLRLLQCFNERRFRNSPETLILRNAINHLQVSTQISSETSHCRSSTINCPLPQRRRRSRSHKLDRIADELFSLTKIERHDYANLFRLKIGLNKYGTAVSGLNAAPGSAAAEAKEAEKTAFDIKLEKFDAAAKIKIIKEVRTFTDLGFMEAKDLVEKAPVVLKKGVTKEQGNPIVEKLKELGATVVIGMTFLFFVKYNNAALL